MGYQEETKRAVLRSFRENEAKYREFWKKHRGEELPEELPNWFAKDLWGRAKYMLVDASFVMNGSGDTIDGTASGLPCEIKTLYYPSTFFDNHPFVLDRRKLDSFDEDGYIAYIVPDFEENVFYWFRFTVDAFRRYGEPAKGGKIDNETNEESGKPLVGITKDKAQATGVWKKKGKKS